MPYLTACSRATSRRGRLGFGERVPAMAARSQPALGQEVCPSERARYPPASPPHCAWSLLPPHSPGWRQPRGLSPSVGHTGTRNQPSPLSHPRDRPLLAAGLTLGRGAADAVGLVGAPSQGEGAHCLAQAARGRKSSWSGQGWEEGRGWEHPCCSAFAPPLGAAGPGRPPQQGTPPPSFGVTK